MTTPLWQLSACEQAAGVRNGVYSAEQLLDSVLARVDARNPEVTAIVVDTRDEAREAARAVDRALAAGEPVGPLAGVPATIKINVDQRGHATSNGMPVLADAVAAEDAPLVTSLRAAGAVLIGRTNTPELSLRATTVNPLHGRTHNPWDADASAGGSSGGAGAAAASGFGAIHHGNDIGGSLRFPSYACGVSSVKPSFGRVPSFNPSQAAERGMLAQLMSVQGVICREVRDVRLGLQVLMRGDPRDPWWVPVPFAGDPPDTPVRVAVTRESHGYPLHPQVAQAIDRAAGWLSDAGYAVEEVSVPSIAEPAGEWFDVAVYEIRCALDTFAREHGSPDLRNIFDWYYRLGKLVDAAGYRERLGSRTAMTRRWNVFLDRYPLVLSPFLMQPVFDWDYDARGYEQTRDLFMSALYSVGVNYLGLPAGVTPVGMAAGRPTGVQLIGRRFREDLILDALEVLERRNGVQAKVLWARDGD
ncbi:MAG: amidase [Pseudomonadales bacterium]